MKGMLTFPKSRPQEEHKSSRIASLSAANSRAGVLKPIKDTTNEEIAGMVEIEFHYFSGAFFR